jgi:hypothetical protein
MRFWRRVEIARFVKSAIAHESIGGTSGTQRELVHGHFAKEWLGVSVFNTAMIQDEYLPKGNKGGGTQFLELHLLKIDASPMSFKIEAMSNVKVIPILGFSR